ncbi:hypothetical protein CCMA1212_007943 [Trichoderma ghanense]|uniref:Uncharacterized protein n=1 Tax=Trichoderma ghanense TaxID=65468 RepID=A0ABY2GY88_9HYPO
MIEARDDLGVEIFNVLVHVLAKVGETGALGNQDVQGLGDAVVGVLNHGDLSFYNNVTLPFLPFSKAYVSHNGTAHSRVSEYAAQKKTKLLAQTIEKDLLDLKSAPATCQDAVPTVREATTSVSRPLTRGWRFTGVRPGPGPVLPFDHKGHPGGDGGEGDSCGGPKPAQGQQLLAPFSPYYDRESQKTRIVREGSYIEPFVMVIDGDGLCARRNMSDFEITRFLKKTLSKMVSSETYDIILISTCEMKNEMAEAHQQMPKVYGAEEEEAAYCVERLLALMALCVKHSGSSISRTAQDMMNAAEEALEKAFDAHLREEDPLAAWKAMVM